MEKEVKSEYDETKVKQERDINSEYVENVCTVSERSEPVSLVINPMQINTQNTSLPEDYFYEDLVKSEYDESERKQEVSSIDFSEYTEDRYSVVEPKSKLVSLDVESVQIHIKDTSLVEDYCVRKLVKSEDNEIEHKQEAVSFDVRSTYTFQINTQHPDWSKEYVIKDEVKSEYDETEFKQENSSIYLESEEFTEDKYSLVEATSDPLSLVMDSVQINTQNIDTSEENIFEPIVKSQHDEIDHKQDVSSIDFKFEYTDDKYTAAGPKDDPISLVHQNPTFQLNSQNSHPSEDYKILKVPYAIQRLDNPVSRKNSEITSRRSNLKPHQLTHTRKKLFSCYVCSQPFSLKGDLKRHMFTHTGENVFTCGMCSKSFCRRGNLKRHLLTHTGEKPFSCDVCFKSFSQKSSLKTHLLTHTDDKFFSCNVCSKAFSLKGDLKRHIFTHTREKLYSCDVCSKALSRRSDLKKHMFTHTGDKFLSCDICSKAFSRRGYLKTHLLTHTGEKFFSCNVCSKSFSQKSNLKTHMFTHTKEKFFSCDVCAKSFSLKSNLKTHILTHRPTGDV